MNLHPEYQPAPEWLTGEGPQIIDNLGIRSGDQLVDIAVRPDLVVERCVGLARELVPAFSDKAPGLVDKLTISLGGGRPLHEILLEMGQRRLARLGVPGETQAALAEIQAVAFRASYLFKPILGATFFDEERPMILINTPKMQGFDEFRATWDEEVAHLVLQLDPQHRPDFLGESWRFIKTNFGLGLAASLPITLFVEAAFGKRETMDRRQFLNPRRLARRYLQAVAVASCLTLPVTQHLSYRTSNSERLAWQAAAQHPTNEETFFKIFEFAFRENPKLAV